MAVTQDLGSPPTSAQSAGPSDCQVSAMHHNPVVSYITLVGNMFPRKQAVLPQQVQLAQEIITKLGDYSTMSDDNDLIANIQGSAMVFSSVGKYSDARDR